MRCVCPRAPWVLAHFKYRAALPDLGAKLITLKKEGYNSGYEYHYYYDWSFGLAIVDLIEAVTGATFPTGHDAKGHTKRIDAAKAWWKKNAARYSKE